MKTFTGKPISPGYAQGHAVLIGAGQEKVLYNHISPEQTDSELARFHAALDSAYRDLKHLQARIQSELGSESSEIFSAHMLFLQDPQFINRVETSIRNDLLSLESALKLTVDELSCILNEADSTYLRERAADVHDLHRRLLRHIGYSSTEQLAKLRPESILVARELLPSDLLEFDRQNLVGIITEIGGETGHAAILARALGIPAVTGIANVAEIVEPSIPIIINGQTGEVVLEPVPQLFQISIVNKEKYDQISENAVIAEDRECITLDGRKVHLYANIGRPFEVCQVADHHLEGIGLFRTEYLFLDEPIAPSFDRQYALYCEIAETLNGLPLVVRTLDLGGDKWPAFLKPKFEANPNLGVRGLRFSLLASAELFRTQIHAALCTARMHDVRIMLPMVLGRADLLEAINIIHEIADTENITNPPAIGALVETPSAVFAIDEILSVADFVSVGTNDLTQFILAADRNALELVDDYTVLHPSVLRAIDLVIKAANVAGKPATVCGEAAADPRVACLLVGMGAKGLSMNPVSAARVRYAVRASNQHTLETLAHEALNSDSSQVVATLVNNALQSSCPEYHSSAVTV